MSGFLMVYLLYCLKKKEEEGKKRFMPLCCPGMGSGMELLRENVDIWDKDY